MPVSTSTHRGFSVPGGTITDTRLGDMSAVKSAIVAIDADIANIDVSVVKTLTVGAANGVAQLDANGMIPAAILPAYVDDVLEYANLAELPNIGESGKIYVTLDNNNIYRWSGSTYVEIQASPGSTDDVTEGSVNKYFTVSRAAGSAPVQSVSGRIGNIELNVNDVDGAVSVLSVGADNGVASLDENGKVPSSQLPASVEYVVEYASTAAFPEVGAQGKIYIAKDSNKPYRWNGSTYLEVSTGPSSTDEVSEGSINKYFTIARAASASPVQSVAGKAGVVTLVKDDVGLTNVDNTSDANKPVSTATQTALNAKIDNSAKGIASGVATLDGSAKVPALQLPNADSISEGVTNKYYTDARASGAAPVQSVAGKTGVVTLNKSDVELGNVDNTSDINKPISTATATALANKVDNSAKGVANGVASLDATGKVPSTQLPSYVDDILEYVNLAAFPATGESGKIYVTADTNKTYRWTGSVYAEISASPGSTDSVAEGSVNKYYTDARASAAAPVQSVAGRTGGVVLTKVDVGLSNVDNTSDASKPVSTATQAALNTKEGSVPTGTTAQYYRGDKSWQTHDKASVGLSNVDNTSDANKQISTATQTALNAKEATITAGTTAQYFRGDKTWQDLATAARAIALTGLSTATNAAITATDTVLGAFGKLQKQVNDLVTSVAGKEGSISIGTIAQYFRGDKTWQTLDKTAVGLANVDNTSDANKPVSTATQTALNAKEATITAGTTSQYYRGDKTWQTHDKTSVGLSNVDNTSDANKPVSTAVTTALSGKIDNSAKGVANGVATLDATGKVPSTQLPSYVDDVLEYTNLVSFPATGESGKIYVALDTNKTYRWSGSAYVYITSGAVDSVAGKTGVVTLVKADVGLTNVDNTSDANKPVSTAQATANTAVQTAAATDATTKANAAQATAIAASAPVAHVGSNGTSHAVVTTSVAGFMSAADKTKLDGVAASANNYVHPAGDGNSHVPVTGTTSSGKVLVAGSTANSAAWTTLDMTYLPDAAFKKSVRAATTVNIGSSFAAGVITGPIGVLVIDGITVALNDRILVKDQTSTLQNGIYYVSTLGTASVAWVLTRTTGANSASELAGALVNVDSGTQGGYLFDTDFKSTDTLNTTAVIWNRIVDTGLASTVVGATPGTAAIGSSLNYARQDHVHPAQTTVSGNAGSATVLATARTINGVSFNGSANITINAVDSTPRAELVLPQVISSAAYTTVLSDSGKHILHPAADVTARIWTIPANSVVAYPIGTSLTFVNQNGAGALTIAINTDVMRLAGAGTVGSRTLAANGCATALKITATEWIISGTGLT